MISVFYEVSNLVHIALIPKDILILCQIYSLFEPETQASKYFLETSLPSLFLSPHYVVRKKNELQLYDYHVLNTIMAQYEYSFSW